MELNTYRYLVNITNLYLYLFVYTHNGDGTFQSHRAIHTHECEISYIVWNCVPVETFHGINISFQGKNTDPWFLERQVTLLRAYLATTSTLANYPHSFRLPASFLYIQVPTDYRQTAQLCSRIGYFDLF